MIVMFRKSIFEKLGTGFSSLEISGTAKIARFEILGNFLMVNLIPCIFDG